MSEQKRLFVTTCSKLKSGQGQEYDRYRPVPSVSTGLERKRANLFTEIRQRSGRRASLHLRGARLGPDFGVADADAEEGALYLPAYQRYEQGSFMSALLGRLRALNPEQDNQQNLESWFECNGLLFISGLYGLVDAREPIQNYDVDMTGMAADHWHKHRRDLTEALMQRSQGSCLLDCCGDSRYSSLIDWNKIPDDTRLFHAVNSKDPKREGSQIRAEAGAFAAAWDDATTQAISAGKGLPGGGVNADIHFLPFAEAAKARSNYLLLSEGREVISAPLCKYVKKQLEKERSRGQPNKQHRQLLDDTDSKDLATSLKIIRDRWDDVFCRHLTSKLAFPLHEVKQVAEELLAVRNDHSHENDFTDDDAERALDSMRRLMDAIGRQQEAEQLRAMRDSILHKRCG